MANDDERIALFLDHENRGHNRSGALLKSLYPGPEAAMLGQPVSMLIPQVVGFKLTGRLPDGSTATDLVLTITELLRRQGVVGKFVEFYGPGIAAVPVADRATLGNMRPEYGSTCAIFPIDDQTLRYLRLTGRPPEQVALVEAYAKKQGLWHDPHREPDYSEHLELELPTVIPSLAGPKRPQDRVPLSEARDSFHASLADFVAAGVTGGAERQPGVPTQAIPYGVVSRTDLTSAESFPASDPPAVSTAGPAPDPPPPPALAWDGQRPSNPAPVQLADGTKFEVDHGSVVIAAITSCTNTSNPLALGEVAEQFLMGAAAAGGLRHPVLLLRARTSDSCPDRPPRGDGPFGKEAVMDLLVQRCAGLDVHRDTVVATVRVPTAEPGRRRCAQHTRSFATTTAGIRALGEWLTEHGVSRAGMESTPVLETRVLPVGRSARGVAD